MTPELRSARGGTLVLGGGFAGAYVARGLGRHGATIVNPANFMLYTPLLPEAATGSIEPRHVTVPLRAMCPHADLLLGSAVALEPDRKVVHVSSEAGAFAVGYERLVVALGSIMRTPDVPGLREHALGLKDIGDAIRLRNHVLRRIELADADPSSAPRRLTFVFAGAGFAGVEAVAELQELTEGALRRHPRLAGVRPRWVLVDSGPRILGQVPESLARFAARTLSGRGVEILSGTVHRSQRRRAVRRPSDRHRDRRLDGRRRCQPRRRAARAPVRRTRPGAGGRVLPRAGDGRRARAG
jgi:NADH dehydrogenase